MEPKENRLGTMPIGKLLMVMSVPMMISFFIQAGRPCPPTAPRAT